MLLRARLMPNAIAIDMAELEDDNPVSVVMGVTSVRYGDAGHIVLNAGKLARPARLEHMLVAMIPELRRAGLTPHVVVGRGVDLLVLTKLATVCDVYLSEREAVDAIGLIARSAPEGLAA